MNEVKKGEDIIREKVVSVIDGVTNTVTNNISSLRIQLDALEAAMLTQSERTKQALEQCIQIGARTLDAVSDIERQVARFKEVVQEVTPNGLPKDEDGKSTSSPDRDKVDESTDTVDRADRGESTTNIEPPPAERVRRKGGMVGT